MSIWVLLVIVFLIVMAFVAGLLVGRRNPKIAGVALAVADKVKQEEQKL